MPARRPVADAPLKPQFFHVLLSLADGPSHGYRIKKAVEERGMRLDPGSLYRVIARLLEEGLITERPGDERGDPRRRLYTLTASGRTTLVAEADRMAGLVDAVRTARALRRPRHA